MEYSSLNAEFNTIIIGVHIIKYLIFSCSEIDIFIFIFVQPSKLFTRFAIFTSIAAMREMSNQSISQSSSNRSGKMMQYNEFLTMYCICDTCLKILLIY